jgi:ATP-dependent Zn protease
MHLYGAPFLLLFHFVFFFLLFSHLFYLISSQHNTNHIIRFISSHLIHNASHNTKFTIFTTLSHDSQHHNTIHHSHNQNKNEDSHLSHRNNNTNTKTTHYHKNKKEQRFATLASGNLCCMLAAKWSYPAHARSLAGDLAGLSCARPHFPSRPPPQASTP